MKIRTFFTLENKVYRAVVHTEDWSERDIQLMEKYGEPEIDVGGTFGAYALAFTLANDLRKIHSESPFSQGFDTRDFDSAEDAEDRVNTWADEIRERISAAVATLRQLNDEYGREEVLTI